MRLLGFWGTSDTTVNAPPAAMYGQRAVPQLLADEMALAASACWVACRAGRIWMGVPAVTAKLSDDEARALIASFQAGYMKEVNRRKRAKVLGGSGLAQWRSQPIPFTSMPLYYQRALASRFLAWRAEILAENPNLDWDEEKGYHWSYGWDSGLAGMKIDEVSQSVYWRGEDANFNPVSAAGIIWPRTPLI